MDPFIIIFSLIVGFLAFYVLKNGGIKGALYGGKIEKAFERVETEKRGMVNSHIDITVISRGSGKNIGLGLVQKTIGSFHMTSAMLNRQQTEKLIQTLQDAIKQL